MASVLLDTGPLVALFKRNDHDHARAVDWFKGYRGALLTTHAVIAEAWHLMNPSARLPLMRFVSAAVDICELQAAMGESTVTSKGQVTIPKEVRRALGIRQGSRVAFQLKQGRVELQVVHRAPAKVESGYGMLRARGRHLPVDFDPATLLGQKRKGSR